MEALGGSVAALPRAAFICEGCSRSLILVNDAAQPLWDHASHEGSESDSRRPTPEGEPDFGVSATRVEDTDELYSSTGDTFVVLPPIGESLHAQQHTPRPPRKENGRALADCSASASALEDVDASIKRIVQRESGGDGWRVLHPLCCGCLDAAIAELEPASAHERRLIRKYERALRRLERSSSCASDPASPAADTTSATIANIQQLEEEEARLLNEISFLESSTSQKENEQLEVMADLAELHMWHVEFWLLFSNHLLRTMRHEDVRDAGVSLGPLPSGGELGRATFCFLISPARRRYLCCFTCV